MIKTYFILILTAFFNFCSQIIFAELAESITITELSFKNFNKIIFDLLITPYFWLALGFFGLSAVLWIIGIKKIALAKAFSFLSLNYLLILVYSFFVLKEEVSIYKVTSCLLIVAGVIILSQSDFIMLSLEKRKKFIKKTHNNDSF